MLEKEVSRTKANEIENERGRSMVEMLGTLAIMGVLAIGGIAGYRYAMDKYNANEILNEVRKRAVTASQQRLLGHSINLSEYGVNTVQGYAIETADNYNGNAGQFTITVKGIEQGVCNQVIDSPLPMVIEELVGGVVVADDVDCTAETNDVLFAFANDLASGSVGGGDGGDGGEGNPPEEFDPTAPENNVICSSNPWPFKCYTCDDMMPDMTASFWVDTNTCTTVCSNREIIGGRCVQKCKAGFFRDSYDGVCYSCNTIGDIEANQSECLKCNGQNGIALRRWENGHCSLDLCPDGSIPDIDMGCSQEKCKENEFWDVTGKCYSCGTDQVVFVDQSGGGCESICNGNSDKSDSRTLERGDYGYALCRKKEKTIQCSTENSFQSYSGACYSCSTISSIEIGENSSCSEACTGSDKRFKRCNEWGQCYCNLCPKNIASLALNTQETCEACGGQWNGSVCCDDDRCAVIPESSQPESSVSGGYQPEQTVSGYY